MEIRSLNEDEMHIFLMLEMMSSVDVVGFYESIKESDGGWVLKAIEKRFKAYNIEADQKVMVTVLSIGDGVVGVCAKHVDYISDFCSKNNKKADWDTFTKQIYAHGIPIL
jgi:hypothetical protein